jgi:hypothetical protein
MPERVEVVPEDLRMSADTVDAHADAIRAGHFAADSRIEAAHAGIPAAAAVALSTTVTKWQADTTAILGRMVGHADGLRGGAAAYVETDEGAGQQINGVDLGL